MNKLLRYIRYLKELCLFIIIFPMSLLYNKNRKIFLVSERGTDARDNGYHFFKYLNEKHPEVESYFVIDKDSPDYKKVSELGKVIQWKSLKHRFLFIGAKYKISTHIMGYSPDIDFYNKLNEFIPLIGKKIFLQHGIISNDLPQLYQEKTRLDLFICGAQPEYEFIKNTFHYKNEEVRYTGLARYDALNEYSTQNQILVMPTWRMWLNNMTESEIANSSYVKEWKKLLSNQKLIHILKDRKITLFFYPHYEMQKHIRLFQSIDDSIVIADFSSYDVQNLLKTSKLLITDYSSIFFDFAYMKKPCVYYHFDRELYWKKHYKKGYFDYDKDAFGKITCDVDSLVEEIIKIINNNFAVDSVYRNNANRCFQIRDGNNCERIFFEISKL